MTLAAGRSHVPLKDGRGRIGPPANIMGAVTVAAGGRLQPSLPDRPPMDALLEEGDHPGSSDPFFRDDLRIGMAGRAGLVDVGPARRGRRIPMGLDGMSRVAGAAGGESPPSLSPPGG